MLTVPERPFLRRDFVKAGGTDGQLTAWCSSGRIRRMLTGVYVPSQLSDSVELRAACVSLLLPDHCVVVERTAAWLHGVDVHAPDERFVVPDPEVVSLRGHGRVRRRGVYAARRDLRDDDVMRLGDVRVTTPVRTALDLACLRGVPPALATLDAFMRHCSLTTCDFERQLPRFHSRRGVVQLRRLVPLASPLAASAGESWTRALLLEHEFPPPTLQFEFPLPHGATGAIDLSYPHLRIAIEYFGEEFHGPDQEAHDLARIRWLEKHGWHVIVVRKNDLGGAALEAWLAELAAVIAERSQPRGKRRYPRGLPFAI